MKTMSKVFKGLFANLAESFLAKIPESSNKYDLESVFLYYLNSAILVFPSRSSSEERVFKITENIEISKADGIDKLTVRFLKDGAEIVSESISEICNLSISDRTFPYGSKVAKHKLISKKGKMLTRLITGLPRYCHWFKISLKK